jgi:hypothetical protein
MAATYSKFLSLVQACIVGFFRWTTNKSNVLHREHSMFVFGIRCWLACSDWCYRLSSSRAERVVCEEESDTKVHRQSCFGCIIITDRHHFSQLLCAMFVFFALTVEHEIQLVVLNKQITFIMRRARDATGLQTERANECPVERERKNVWNLVRTS